MLQTIRGSAKVVFWILLVSFVGVFLFAETSGLTSRGVSRGSAVGEVNGVDITYDRWDTEVRNLAQQEQRRRGSSLTQDEMRRIEDIAFQQIVDSVLLAQEYRRRGISVSDEEIVYASRSMPHPELMQNPDLQTDGRFDPEKYQRLLSTPAARQQGLTLFLERYYRTEIPRQKLFEQIAAGVYIPDSRLWRMWQDEHDSAQISYVAFRPMAVPDSAVKVTEDEIEAYFEEHKKDFGTERPGRAVLSLVALPRPVTAADSAAVRDRALELRGETIAGAKFEDVAKRESADSASAAAGGLLGKGGRGRFVPEFERAAYALPVGAISQPVLTPFGYHLIKVDARSGDSITVRHILLRIQQSDSSASRVNVRADSLADMAAATDQPAKLDSAAKIFGLPVARVVAIEGEPVSWNGKYVQDVGAWAFRGANVGETSDLIDTEEAFYLARIDSLTPARKPRLDDVRDDIRRILTVEKKVASLLPRARTLADAVAGGKTLEQAAGEAGGGIKVERTGMFTRVSMVPGVGRLNQAIGAAFGLAVGAVSAPNQTDDAVFIIRVDRRVNADRTAWEAQRATQRQQLLLRLRRQRVQDFVSALRDEADIEDRRRQVQAMTREIAS